MSRNSLFHAYYDALYQDKDYQKETDLVFKLSRKFGLKSPQKVLEIGCGTGNHTIHLAKIAPYLVAIDIDERMVKLAKAKIPESNSLKIIHTSIEDLKEDNFDLALAMFNVVTYISKPAELHSFMKGVSHKLVQGAVFVFDCWNGVAAIKDPPQVKKGKVDYRGEKIEYSLIPTTNFLNQRVRMDYTLKVTSGKRVRQDSFSFVQMLWTPAQIIFAAEEAGLEVVLCSPLGGADRVATENDWKIIFCCRKSRQD